MMQGFSGALDGGAQGFAMLVIPPDSGQRFIGMTFHWIAATIDPLGRPSRTTNTTSFTVLP